MPKPVAQLESKARPLPERILEFLSKDPSNAYRVDEIYVAVESGTDEQQRKLFRIALALSGADTRREATSAFEAALDGLVQEGKVRSFDDLGLRYFAALPG